ncbi:hypothetical protein Scep_009670 [Stephania cephalantha]|uniref:Uncharacterized protein n=1 Tax=Stephania cephalantha TaxID=152367 RepID=A0AAP0PEJ7_9MAGN
MKTKFNQNFKIEVQENANQDYDSKVLTPSREGIHESHRRPETQSRRSRWRPAAAEEPARAVAAKELGPSSGGKGSGRRAGGGRRRSGVRAVAANARGGDQRRRHKGPCSGRITGPQSPVDGQRRRIEMWGQRQRIRGANNDAGEEDHAATPEENSAQRHRRRPTVSGRGMRRVAVDGGCR